MNEQLLAIQKILKVNANPLALNASNKFVPGAKNVYGVRMPVINELAKQFKEGSFQLVNELWQSGAFEEKILAAKMLGLIAKQDAAQSLQLVEMFANGIADWAVCDAVGMQALHPIRKTQQKEIFALAKRLNTSPNLWKRRLSLVLVEWYTRDKSLHADIHKLVHVLEKDNEYYVQKAVVWIKRNMAKVR